METNAVQAREPSVVRVGPLSGFAGSFLAVWAGVGAGGEAHHLVLQPLSIKLRLLGRRVLVGPLRVGIALAERIVADEGSPLKRTRPADTMPQHPRAQKPRHRHASPHG